MVFIISFLFLFLFLFFLQFFRYRICWNFIFGQCSAESENACSFSHKLFVIFIFFLFLFYFFFIFILFYFFILKKIHNLSEKDEKVLSQINTDLKNRLCLRYFKNNLNCFPECEDSHHVTLSQLSKSDQEHFATW